MKTAAERRSAVIEKYLTLIGRNVYSQVLRDYCFTPYKDGKYYSDCSSSISYSYEEAGEGFGILNTAGMYNSKKLVTIELSITNGVPDDFSMLRIGDMLLFAGNDSSRPKCIGHVEMVCQIDGASSIICGHGSGLPSIKNLREYCKSRYSSYAPGGWRKGLVCVRRYIQGDTVEESKAEPKLSGWIKEPDGWRFYLGNTGTCVRNSWYLDADGNWYWFDGAGRMVHDEWYKYKGSWYYFTSNGSMAKGLQNVRGEWYALDSEGRMITEPFSLEPDDNGALRNPELAL